MISLYVFQRAYTSAPGEGGVVSFKDYDRKFSSHAVSCCHVYRFYQQSGVTAFCWPCLQNIWTIMICFQHTAVVNSGAWFWTQQLTILSILLYRLVHLLMTTNQFSYIKNQTKQLAYAYLFYFQSSALNDMWMSSFRNLKWCPPNQQKFHSSHWRAIAFLVTDL